MERLPRSGEDNAPVEEEQAEEGEAAAHSALKPSATIREKIGHRRVMEGGQVTYKKVSPFFMNANLLYKSVCLRRLLA